MIKLKLVKKQLKPLVSVGLSVALMLPVAATIELSFNGSQQAFAQEKLS